MQQVPVMLPPGFNVNEHRIVFVQAPPGGRYPAKWNQRCAKAIGITLILIAVIAVACNIGLLASSIDPAVSVGQLGTGFWAGAPVLVTGVLLTASGFRPGFCVIVSVLVMSILSMLFDIGFFTIGVGQMTVSNLPDIPDGVGPSMLASGSVYIVVGLVSFGLLLTASILSCVSLCSGNAYSSLPYVHDGMVVSQGVAMPQHAMDAALFKDGHTPKQYVSAPHRSFD